MCINDNFNKICFEGTFQEINDFMDKCEQDCIKYANCDYYLMLDNQLKERFDNA